MSRMIMVSVFDVAAQFYHPPICFRASGAALRWFEDAIRRGDKADALCAHPDQFQLFSVGYFDDFSAKFDLLPSPELLVHGSSYIDH